MPATSVLRSLPGPFYLILLASLACAAQAQLSYKNQPHHTLQLQLPWHGPGAALLNPAGIGGTNHGFLQVGIFSSVSGKAVHRTYQGAVATGEFLPVLLAAGLGGYSNGSVIDGSNALYLESYHVPSIAIATPAGRSRPQNISLGIAFPIHAFNAFGVAESFAYGVDLGLHWVGPDLAILGRPQLGLAVGNLVRPKAGLPANMGVYELPRAYSALLTWTSPGSRVELHGEYQFTAWEPGKAPVHSGRSELRSRGVEVRPWEGVGFVAQRTRNGPVSLGSSVRLALPELPVFRAAVHLSHDRFRRARPVWLWGKGEGEGDGRGYLLASFLSVEY